MATVKSRLQRGLAMLRERLDRDGEAGEWRAGLAATFGIGGGLRIGAAAAAGVLFMGTMAKVMVGGGVAMAAVAAIWWATADAPPRVLPLAEDPTLAPIAANTDAGSPATAPDRSEALTAAPVPELPPTTLRGRCVDDEGAPLAGCTVALSGRSRGYGAWGAKTWLAPAALVTNVDGCFEFVVRPPSSMIVYLEARAEARMSRSGRWGSFEPHQVIDTGDIMLPRGFTVTGTVVEQDGVPMPGGNLWLSTLPVVAPASRDHESTGAKVADGGAFTFASPIPAGVWPLSFESQGYRLVSPDHVTVDPVRGAGTVRVMVRRVQPPKIEGIVVDEQGAPVAWVPLRAVQADTRAIATGMTGRNGRFSFVAGVADPQPVRVEPSISGIPGSRQCQLARRAGLRDWGSTDVIVVVHRPLTVALTVVERGSGAPVTGFSVKSFPDACNAANQYMRLAGEHQDSRVTLDNVWPGGNSLVVIPEEPDLVPSARIGFTASAAGTAPLRVELERMRKALVRVTVADGAPLAGVKVEIIAPGTAPLRLDQHVFEPRDDPLQSHTNFDFRFAEPRSAAMTDADGRAEVLVSGGTETLAVRVKDGAVPLALVQPAPILPGQQLDVVVPKAGSITGKVRVRGDSLAGFLMACWRVGARPPQRDEGVRLQGDGSFQVCGLAAGGYCLQLRRKVVYRAGPVLETTTVPMDVAIPEVEVETGEDTRIDVDAAAAAPASVHGRVLVDGAAPAAAHVFLRNPDGVCFGLYFIEADGRFAATDVPPGSYRVGLVLGDPQGGAEILPVEPILLAAGQDLQRDFAFTHRVLEVRVVGTDGASVTGLYCQFEADGFHRSCRTDTEGRVRLDPAPAGTVRVTAYRDGRATLIGETTVPLGKTEHAATLTLPSAK